MTMNKRPEILSPAGDFEKLRSAVYFGADAVYLAGKHFGMRAASGNFTDEELKEAVSFCHENGVKVYVTVNIMPRDGEYAELRRFLTYLGEIGADAVIVSDPGVAALLPECAPGVALHVSTQASVVSAATCKVWYNMGAKRVVLARELSLETIKNIKRNIPEDLEIECFVHGSMCVAYSGRCLLSQHFVGRDANRGACAQPCRWIYSRKTEIAEEKRENELLPVIEDGGDSFIMSSKDMCMIEHIPELCEAGIDSFKLEGRVRSAYYTAVVTNTYKMALEAYMRDKENYVFDPAMRCELDSVSHREYGTGFFFTDPHDDANLVTEPGYIREKAYLATAVGGCEAGGVAKFIQRNKTLDESDAQLLTPGKTGIGLHLSEMKNEAGEKIESAPHPGMIFTVRSPIEVKPGDILRGA